MPLTPAIQAVIDDCARQSRQGTIGFGAVVGRLLDAGVESYYADYRHGEIRYYLPDGTTYSVALALPHPPVAEPFRADAVQAAIRSAQRGDVLYPEFVRLTCEAGCLGYFVWLSGRQVQYLGRRGEIHVERFPD